MKNNPNHSMVDHPLDMFMSAVLAVLVIGAMLHLPAGVVENTAEHLAVTLASVGLLAVDALMFANSFMQWKLQRMNAEEVES